MSSRINPILVALIGEGLRRMAPQVRIDDVIPSDLLSRSHVSTRLKHTLLERAYAHGGGALLLRLGQVFLEPDLPPHPLMLMFRNADTVDDLLYKVQALYRFMHATHKLEVVDSGPQRVVFDHLGRLGPTTNRESLWTCGLVAAGLMHLGCTHLQVTLPLTGDPEPVIDEDGVHEPKTTVNTHRFEYRWEHQDARTCVAGLDQYLLETCNLQPIKPEGSTGDQVTQILTAHLDRRWTLSRVAARLDIAPRSLQRALAAEGSSFRQLLGSARLGVAQELLLDNALSITEIGIVTGFSDSGHFSRRFREATGSTPSVWREAHRS